MDIAAIQAQLSEFASERDWNQYHSPKNLAMALAVEAAELMEIFQWVGSEESRRIVDSPSKLQAAAEEIADISIYLFRLADVLGLDIERVIKEKIEQNAAKYPEDEPHRWSME